MDLTRAREALPPVDAGGPVIACRGLTRRFGHTTVVDGIDFDLPAGSLCAFLGPNGAGKSTTLRMLTGLLPPSAGEATVLGHDVTKASPALKHIVGVVPEGLGLFDNLTVEEHLHMTGPLYGLSMEETRDRSDQLLKALGLAHARHRFADECSHGMRKKTALALAMLHDPRVLFLDEPFEGIDPASSRSIHDLLLALADRGLTIFFTSHALSLVERIASHLILIREGRIAWQSTSAELGSSVEDMYFDLVDAPGPAELPWLGSRRS